MASVRWKRKRRLDEIPTTSFADIAFLLIIFFILTASFSKTEGFVSELPAGKVSDATDTGKTPTVYVQDGEVKFNDNPVTMVELRKNLQNLKLAEKKEEADRIILMEGAAGVSYQWYYEVMAAISRAGGIVAIVKEKAKK